MRSGFSALKCLALTVVLSVTGMPSAAFSQANKAAPAEPVAIVYKPPMRGAPAGGARIAAAVRGQDGETPVLVALAPDHVGITSQRQPVLYWYISKPTSSRIEFTLNDEQRGKTVVRADLPSPKQPGIQAINLADYKFELSPDIVYHWFVTLEADPAQPSKDVYNGGSIMLQEPPPEMNKRLAGAGTTGAAAVYASEGFWYDALYATWKPGKEDKSFRQQRISLLKQVGFGVSGPWKSKPMVEGENELLALLQK